MYTYNKKTQFTQKTLRTAKLHIGVPVEILHHFIYICLNNCSTVTCITCVSLLPNTVFV